MRETFSAFGSEVFRPLMTVLLPGSVAISTPVIALIQRNRVIEHLVETKRVEAAIIAFLVALAVGEILEDIGSRIEHYYDERSAAKNKNFYDEWYEYLSLTFSPDPVGHRYLRTLVLRLKFEFGLSLGTFICGEAVFLTRAPFGLAITVSALALIVAVYLMWEAYDTHEVLRVLRHEMLSRLQPHRNAALGTAAGR